MQVTKSKTGSTQLASTRKKNDDDGFQELPEGQVGVFFWSALDFLKKIQFSLNCCETDAAVIPTY